MGIRVQCPHGHAFKVKDKYAGKVGLCPHCKDQTKVRVPDLGTSGKMRDTYQKTLIQEHQAEHPVHSSSVFDDPEEGASETSASLLSGSMIQHHLRCKCGEAVPMWFAKCPKCGIFIDHR